MPKLPEYDAPERTLTPSDKGAAAFEQAGRRIGPAYNEAATLTREKGAVASDLIKQRRWPFDAQELYRSLDEIEKAKAQSGGGVGFKVEGGGSGGGSLGGSDHSGGKGHRSKSGADVGGMSIAAAGLGRMAAAMAKGNQYRNSIIDPRSGKDLALPENQPKGYTALENGRLVHYSNDGRRLDEPEKFDKWGNPVPTGPNARAQAAAQADASGQWNPALDWDNPQNKSKRMQEYQHTGVDPVTNKMEPPPGSAFSPSYNNGGIEGADSYGNPILPPDRDYYGNDGAGVASAEQSYRDNTSVTNQTESPWDRLSPSGAADARSAVEDMRSQFDSSGAGTDAFAPSGGGSDDTNADYGGREDQ